MAGERGDDQAGLDGDADGGAADSAADCVAGEAR
jgi:hypothetical protein